MKTLERGQDKIKKICDKIRHETIEPAKEEGEAILAAAKQKSNEIVAGAEKQANDLLDRARRQIEQERNVFHSSLQQAAKQTIESLRQTLESKFFNEDLQALLERELSNPKVIAEMINGIVKSIDREGITTDLTIVIPKAVSADDVASLLIESVRKRLKERPIELGNFGGGVQVKLQNKKMTLELTDRVLQELVSNYVRKDLRQLVFGG